MIDANEKKVKALNIGQRVSISGKLCEVSIITRYGCLLSGCTKYKFSSLCGKQAYVAIRWPDGEVGTIKQLV